MHNLNYRFRIEIPEDVRYVGVVRHLIQEFLTSIYVCDADILAIEMLVSESCSNVCRHSKSEDQKYVVLFSYHYGLLTIKVVDCGVGYDKNNVLPIGTERDDMDGSSRLGGWGIPLIQQLSDSAHFLKTVPHGTTVIMTKCLSFNYEKTPDQTSI